MTNRKVLLLVALVALWLGLLAYRIFTHEPPKTAPLTYVKGATASPATAKRGQPELRVKVELLNPPRVAVQSPRNIFAPVQVYVPPPPPAPPPPPLRPLCRPHPRPPRRSLPAQRARSELAQYKYLGYVAGGGHERAFLARGKDLFTVPRGESLVGGIVLKDVTPSYVILLEPQTRIEVTVALSGT